MVPVNRAAVTVLVVVACAAVVFVWEDVIWEGVRPAPLRPKNVLGSSEFFECSFTLKRPAGAGAVDHDLCLDGF